MAPRVQKMVTVYDKEGNAHKLTVANARDLVTSGGSWRPNVVAHPAARSPYAVPAASVPTISAAQEVLDRIGGIPKVEQAPAEDVPEPEIQIEDVVVDSPVEVPEEDDAYEPEDE